MRELHRDLAVAGADVRHDGAGTDREALGEARHLALERLRERDVRSPEDGGEDQEGGAQRGCASSEAPGGRSS